MRCTYKRTSSRFLLKATNLKRTVFIESSRADNFKKEFEIDLFIEAESKRILQSNKFHFYRRQFLIRVAHFES